MERGKEYKAVVTDWDDLIVRTFETVVEVYTAFAEFKGLGTEDERVLDQVAKRLKVWWGYPMEAIFRESWQVADAEAIVDEYLSFSGDLAIPPFDGVVETIKSLKDRYLMGVVSSGPKEMMLRTWGTYFLDLAPTPEQFYLFFLGKKDCVSHKPDPQAFTPAMKHLDGLGIGVSDVLYVGDSLHDLRFAGNVGMDFVAVTTGLIGKEQFLIEGMKSESILTTFTQLPDFLKNYSFVPIK